jgi:uncharacterized protein
VYLVGLAFAALIGLSLALLGGGGSIVTVPVLVYVLGFDPKQAIAMSLPVVGVTSLVSATMHWRRGHVQLMTALTVGLITVAGAFVGARLSTYLSGAVQLVILSVVMLAAALSMFRGAPADGDGTASMRWELLVPVALTVGVLTGLVGIGGGFLVVPALVLLARVPMREAVGTSLLVIALNASAGFIGHLGEGALPWGFLAAFTAAAVAGALAGAQFAPRVPQATLRRAFAWFLLFLGSLVLFQNRSVFRAFLPE